MRTKLTPQKLTYGLLTLLALALLVMGFFYYQLNNIIQKDISKLQEEAVNQELAAERIDQLKSLNHKLSEFDDISEDINEILPSDKKQDQIIGQLAALADDAGFNIESISFESTGGLPSDLSQTVAAGIPGLRVTPVKFAINQKEFSQMMTFLRSVENLQRYTQVESLSINTASTEDNQDLLNFNMTLHLYLQGEAEKPAKDSQKGGQSG